MNSFGSFKLINQSFERFEDSGNALNRLHSDFEKIINYEQSRAVKIFNATLIQSDLSDSFAYVFPESKGRINDGVIQEMIIQEHIAQKIFEEMHKQHRWN